MKTCQFNREMKGDEGRRETGRGRWGSPDRTIAGSSFSSHTHTEREDDSIENIELRNIGGGEKPIQASRHNDNTQISY